jgi:L-threonylcarbamoyladenylate synthase
MDIVDILKTGGIGVAATDTLYGIVGQALNHDTVERIYDVKKRTPSKPFIILISEVADLELFDITLSESMREKIRTYWPGPVSIVLDCANPDLEYLHRGTNTLAFRLPAKEDLRKLLSATGPLVAPSANPEGMTPAVDIETAKKYFGSEVDFYSEGTVSARPSTIIRITPSGEQILRP